MSRPHSVQWWLGALVSGVAGPVLLLVLILGVVQVRRERGESYETALRIAQATAARLRAMHVESGALLVRMASRPGVASLDPAACRAELSVVDFLPRYADLYLFDDTGRLVCSGNADPQNKRVSSATLRWVETELRTGRLRDGVHRMQPVEGETMMITPARVGARGATIVLAEFADVLGRASIIPASVILILDRNGTIVARTDSAPLWSGGGLADADAQGDEGIVEARGRDGESQQYAFVSIRELGWTVYGGVPSWEIERPVREALGQGVLVVLVLAVGMMVLTLIVARRIGRPMRALAEAAAVSDHGVYARVKPEEGPREVVGLAEAFNDMIDRREKADQLASESERQLKALSERLLTVQEEERARIARELHDDLGQSLTALKMDVIGLLQATEPPPALYAIRDRILRTLDATVTSVQRISSELRPSVLDDLGLVAAIEAEARLFEERSGIECEVSVHGEMPVARDHVTAIYRIVQEALTNVARHSNATRTELRFRNRGDELVLEIRDDGRGVTAAEVNDSKSLGLIGIRERAAVIGGTVQIEGVAGRGTIVSVRIPLEAKVRLA